MKFTSPPPAKSGAGMFSFMEEINVILRRFKNWFGRQRGFSHCLRCKDTWNWKPSHITMYGSQEGMQEGMFPLCHECWLKLTPVERLKYYYQLISSWEKEGEFLKKNQKKDYTVIRMAIEDVVLNDKEQFRVSVSGMSIEVNEANKWH